MKTNSVSSIKGYKGYSKLVLLSVVAAGLFISTGAKAQEANSEFKSNRSENSNSNVPAAPERIILQHTIGAGGVVSSQHNVGGGIAYSYSAPQGTIAVGGSAGGNNTNQLRGSMQVQGSFRATPGACRNPRNNELQQTCFGIAGVGQGSTGVDTNNLNDVNAVAVVTAGLHLNLNQNSNIHLGGGPGIIHRQNANLTPALLTTAGGAALVSTRLANDSVRFDGSIGALIHPSGTGELQITPFAQGEVAVPISGAFGFMARGAVEYDPVGARFTGQALAGVAAVIDSTPRRQTRSSDDSSESTERNASRFRSESSSSNNNARSAE